MGAVNGVNGCFTPSGSMSSTSKPCDHGGGGDGKAAPALPLPPPPPSPIPFPCAPFAGCSGTTSGSVKVPASVNGSPNHSACSNVSTVGGRQILRTQNGMLDLRWYQSQNQDPALLLKGSQLAGGLGGSFGYLDFLYLLTGGATGLHFTGEGGISRLESVIDTNVPLDPRNPNSYVFGSGEPRYFRYDAYSGTYFYYETGTPPYYVGIRTDRQGYSLYYNYDSNQLKTIYGDTGKLTPYFGYDTAATPHINRLYLQDNVGSDHRETYYYYDGDKMSVIVEPEGVTTYFTLSNNFTATLNRVNQEVDPDGFTTYMSYDSAPGSINPLLTQNKSNTTCYFFDDFFPVNNRGIIGWSAVRYQSGSGRQYKREAVMYASGTQATGGYNILQENLGGSMARSDYGSDYLLTASVDQNGNQTYFQYNTLKLKSAARQPDGGVTYFAYAANGRDLTAQLGSRNAQVAQLAYYSYSPSGKPHASIDFVGNTAYWNYDAQERLTSIVDGLNNVTYLYYDTYNNNNAVVDAFNNSAYYAFNANGKVTTYVDQLGRTSYYSFDKLDQLLSSSSPTGETTTYGLSKRGLVSRVGRPGGRAAYYEYDAYYNLAKTAQVLDSGLIASYFQYTDQNVLEKSLDANGNAAYFGYDFRGLRTRSMDPLGNTTYFSLDAVGNLGVALDANGHFSRMDYDVKNRLSAVTRGVVGMHPQFQSSIEAHWNMNETSGDRFDDSGNAHTLFDKNAVGSTAGLMPSNAANFVAASATYFAAYPASYFSYSDNFVEFGISAWIKVNSAPANTYMTIASKWGSFGDHSYRLAIHFSDSTPTLPTLVWAISYNGSDGQVFELPMFPTPSGNGDMVDRWHHVAVGFKWPQRICIFVDGMLLVDDFSNTEHLNPFCSKPFSVGCDYDSGAATNFFDGAIDELYVFNKFPNQLLVNQLTQQRLNVTFAGEPADLQTAYFGYDFDDNRTASLDARGNATYFGYDANSRPIAVLNALGNSSYFNYDAQNNLTVTQNNRGFAAYFGYDALTRQTTALNALNQASYFGYDTVGNRTRALLPTLAIAYFAYDGSDRLVASQDASGFTTYFGYDLVSNQTQVLDARGYATYFRYDLLDRRIATLDALNQSAYFGYDANSNRTTVLSPRGYGTYFGYDALDRLSKTLDAESGTAYFGFDAVGNVYTTLDALQRPTYFGYDFVDRVTQILDTMNNSVYFGYDLTSNRTLEVDARGDSTYYCYDAINRLTAALDPLQTAAYYGYDANSNLTQSLDNKGNATYFGYDALDRRTSIFYTLGTAPQYFSYDASANLTKTLDDWGAAYYGYDFLNRTVARSTPNADAVYYEFDAVSNLTKVQYPRDGSSCYYGYDGAQRMIQALSPYNKGCYWVYDASSNVTAKTLGNGVTSWASFDKTERMLSLRYAKADGTAIAYFDYARDLTGNITKIGRETDLAIYYSYDDIDRLTAEYWRKKSDNSQIYAFSYSYDATGNRLQMRRETTSGTEFESAYYSYAADNSLTKRREQHAGVNTYYYYDLNGALNTMMEGANSTYFEYAGNQLVSKVTPPIPDGNPWQFYYDARLNRYKIDRGGSVRYLLWEGLNLMEERDSMGALIARYTYGYSPIYGIGNCVEIYLQATGLTYTLAMDHRGTGHVLLDNTGAEVGRRYYDAFGVILGETGSWPVDLGYQTNWQTIKIGSKWWGLSASRMYDFASGKFTQRDALPGSTILLKSTEGNALGIFDYTLFSNEIVKSAFDSDNAVLQIRRYIYFSQLQNLYNSSINSPLLFIDPSGLCIVCAVKTFVTSAVVAVAGAYVVSALLGVAAVAASPLLAAGAALAAAGLVAYGGYQTALAAYRLVEGKDYNTHAPLTTAERVNEGAGLLGGMMGGGLVGKGYLSGIEITGPIGPTGTPRWRIAPFGNRTGNKYGELPHYHRRVPNPARPNDSLPGQGITRHRPWQPMTEDKAWWDCF